MTGINQITAGTFGTPIASVNGAAPIRRRSACSVLAFFRRRASILAVVLFAHATFAVAGVPDGRSLYASCVACHGKQGEGLAAVKAPAIAGLESWYVDRQLKNFAIGLRGNAPGDVEGATMRAAASLIKSEAERTAVAASSRALRHGGLRSLDLLTARR